MQSIKEKYLDYLKTIKEEVIKVKIDSESIDFFQESIHNIELLVPVIGAFSAGKSTLINSFLGKEYLPVGITPETSLATELRYSDKEFIEAVKADESIVVFSIDDWKRIKERAKEFKYLKLFIKNDNIKMIQPLILVDMPGFDSPLDLHNQAIMNYLNKGVHNIVLTSVEDGTITGSMLRQLSDIQEFGRNFSFFLSKSNLRSQSEVETISAEIKKTVKEKLDISKDIISINGDGGKSLEKILNEINPEEIFESVFNPELTIHFHTILDKINDSISTLTKDKEENENAILELKKGIGKIIDKRDLMVKEAKEKYSDVNVNRIVGAVGKDLSDAIDELTNAAMMAGSESLSQTMTDIIRHSLLFNLKTAVSDMNIDIIDDFALELRGPERTENSFSMNENLSEKIANNTKTIINNANTSLVKLANKQNKSNDNAGNIYKPITTIAAITTSILSPLVEVMVVFLPDIISFLFKSFHERNQREKVRNDILSSMIPSIKTELRGKLPAIFQKQVVSSIEEIGAKFENKLQDKQKTIITIEAEKKNEISNIEEEIINYTTVKNNISSAANSALSIRRSEMKQGGGLK